MILASIALALATGACGRDRNGPAVTQVPPTSTTVTADSGTPLPSTDAFYRWTVPLTQDPPGTILRTRTISFATDAGDPAVKTTQLLYSTTDELGHRTVAVTTVFSPINQPPTHPTRVIAYQTAYDALGAQCDPSYTIRAGTLGQTGFILGYMAAGNTLVMPDYEGEDLAYGAGQQSGYETLDAIRAAEKAVGAPPASTPVGMLGYSGGSIATEFASELAPTYAPDLDIVGAAEGGIPVDLFHNLTYVNQPGSTWSWVIPAVLEGLARGFDIHDLDTYLTPQGIATVRADQTQCAGTFGSLSSQQLFKPQYQDTTKVPILVHIFDELIMSRTGTPRSPLLIENGRSDATGDGVMVAGDVQQLAYVYCQRGVPVELHIRDGLDHQSAGGPFFQDANSFLTDRLANQTFHNGCADIKGGNSIAPVPVPAS